MQPKRVLIVEDSISDQLVISKQLSGVTWEVVSVDSAESAMRVLERDNNFQLAVVDWNLPGMDGLQLVRHLRQSDTHSKPIIVMITAECDIEKINEAIMAGVDEYIMKPISKETFWEKLRIVGIDATHSA